MVSLQSRGCLPVNSIRWCPATTAGRPARATRRSSFRGTAGTLRRALSATLRHAAVGFSRQFRAGRVVQRGFVLVTEDVCWLPPAPARRGAAFWLLTPGFHIPLGYQGRSPWLVGKRDFNRDNLIGLLHRYGDRDGRLGNLNAAARLDAQDGLLSPRNGEAIEADG